MDVQSTANAVSMSVLLLLTLAITGGIIYFRFWPKSLRRPPSPTAPVVGVTPPPAPVTTPTPPPPPAPTPSTPTRESGWKKAWRSIRQVIKVVVVVGLVLLLVIFSANSNWDPTNPPTLLVAVMLLVLIALWLIKSWKQLVLAVIVMAVIIFFLPSIPGRLEGFYRGLNHGDWSASSDYEPRTVYKGTVTFTRIGQVEEFYAKGEVLLKNEIFSQASCLAISPISKFFLNSLEGNRRNFLTPRSREKELVMVEARIAGTCPNPQT